LLGVAFGRWPIEQCFEQTKNELGMDHFEVRSWAAIHRHFYITQLSHLFCSRVHQDLREKKDRDGIPDGGTGSDGGVYLGRVPRPWRFGPKEEVPEDDPATGVLSIPK